jgi:hypothetical protein
MKKEIDVYEHWWFRRVRCWCQVLLPTHFQTKACGAVVKRLMHLIHSPTGLCFGFGFKWMVVMVS